MNVTCGILTFDSKIKKFDWYRNGIIVSNSTNPDMKITQIKMNYLLTKVLTFKNIQKRDAGVYECHSGVFTMETYLDVQEISNTTYIYLCTIAVLAAILITIVTFFFNRIKV